MQLYVMSISFEKAKKTVQYTLDIVPKIISIDIRKKVTDVWIDGFGFALLNDFFSLKLF